mmetsp:Transcript_4055/g.11847  ORF Transcript_4055/g.11847 Transcript_4055/m.11847 type:complete len:214 (+) Transcript_4055:884-1525(+)
MPRLICAGDGDDREPTPPLLRLRLGLRLVGRRGCVISGDDGGRRRAACAGFAVAPPVKLPELRTVPSGGLGLWLALDSLRMRHRVDPPMTGLLKGLGCALFTRRVFRPLRGFGCERDWGLEPPRLSLSPSLPSLLCSGPAASPCAPPFSRPEFGEPSALAGDSAASRGVEMRGNARLPLGGGCNNMLCAVSGGMAPGSATLMGPVMERSARGT